MSYLMLYLSIQGVICVNGKLVVKATIHLYTLETKLDPYLSEIDHKLGHMIMKNMFKSHIEQNNFMNLFILIYREKATKP